MRIVLTLACVLFVAHNVAAQCPMLRQFATTFVPACDPNDLYIKWPNYSNQYTYYTCNGVNNPVATTCPNGQVFIYVLQQCGSCGSYIPPVQCSQLRTQNPPNCVPNTGGGGNGGNGGLPTPNYPNNQTEKTTTVKTTTVKTTKVTTEKTPPTPGGPTPPTGKPTPPNGNDIPPPPSPGTNAPGVPMPPTPEPTPPSVNVEPPHINLPPVINN